MGIEIERKYLVHSKKLPTLHSGVDITQGYIMQDDDNTVLRVRITREVIPPIGIFKEECILSRAYLTLKTANDGITRAEFEYEIPITDARDLMQTCDKILTKTRYTYQYTTHLFEIDEFHGNLEGLIMCEVELNNADEEVSLPSWIRVDVSDDDTFYNSNLIELDFDSLNMDFYEVDIHPSQR